jgi:hypothetical protein
MVRWKFASVFLLLVLVIGELRSLGYLGGWLGILVAGVGGGLLTVVFGREKGWGLKK